MDPSTLKHKSIYNYSQLDGTLIQIKYWNEQLNYWLFTTVTEPQKMILLHKIQIINNITEI
jgi:hypothetical protein